MIVSKWQLWAVMLRSVVLETVMQDMVFVNLDCITERLEKLMFRE